MQFPLVWKQGRFEQQLAPGTHPAPKACSRAAEGTMERGWVPPPLWKCTSPEPATGSAPQAKEGPEPLTDTGVSSPCWGAALLVLLRKINNEVKKLPVFPWLPLWLSRNVFCCVRI